MPSCDISHNGDISRSRLTCLMHFCAVYSISSNVVNRPIPNLLMDSDKNNVISRQYLNLIRFRIGL